MYIHIGAGKTGTSAIQAFMNSNREKLAKDYSCLYPDFDSRFFDKGTQHNHSSVFRNKNPDAILDMLSRMFSFCDKKNIKKIVLSWESLLDNPMNAEIIFKGIKKHTEINCVIIAYIRRQDHWLEAAWKQWGVKNKNFDSFDEFIQKKEIKWLENLNKWAEVFGKDNVKVYPYEKMQLPDGLINHFLRSLDIDMSNDIWIDPQKNNRNENFGFNSDLIEIFRLNRGFYSGIHDNRIFNMFSEYLGDNFRKSPFEKYSLLSPEKRRAILEKYEPMNRIIAKEYMARADGRVFYEPWLNPNEPWEPYEGLTVETVVPIFTQVLYNMDYKYQRQFQKLRPRNNSEKSHKYERHLSKIKKRIMNALKR